MRNLVILGLISFTFVASRNHTDLPLNITSTVQNVTEAVTQTTDEPTTTTEDYNKREEFACCRLNACAT